MTVMKIELKGPDLTPLTSRAFVMANLMLQHIIFDLF